MTGSPQISQIHLIHKRTGARTVIHIGASVRGSEREIALEGTLPLGAISIPGSPDPPDGTKIVKLRFTEVNPTQFDAPVVLELVTPDTELSVNGRGAELLGVTPGLLGVPLNHNATVKIDDQEFQAEIHTVGRLPPPRLQTSWMTVTGPVQDHNEDALGIYQDRRAHLYVLADGVGGAEAGERVSEYAVKYLLRTFHYYLKDREDEELDWQSMLSTAIQAINIEVRHFARLSAASAGTTLTAVILAGWDATIAHIGDSRLYQWNGLHLRRVTSDHVTFIQERGQRGATVQRAMLLKAIGKADTIEPDIFTARLQPDDRLILCSDGVYNALADADLEDILKNTGITSTPERIINLANERYNSDNLSVIMLRAQPRAVGAPRPERPNMRALPKSARVYIGDDRRWRARLKAVDEISTHPETGVGYRLWRSLRRAATGRNLVRLIVIGVLIVVIGVPLLWVVRTFTPRTASSVATQQLTVIQQSTETMRASLMQFDTPVHTPSPVPTATRPPLPTPSPEITSAPPTITLPPFPTMTLQSGAGSN